MTTQPPAPPTDDEIVDAMLMAYQEHSDLPCSTDSMHAAFAIGRRLIREAALREAAAATWNVCDRLAILALIPDTP